MSQCFFQKPDIEGMRKKGFLGIDMHFHTQYSMDAISGLPEVLKRCKKLGIGVAVIDHNQIKGNLKIAKNKQGILIIPGIETTCSEGVHIHYYFYSHTELEEFYRKELQPFMKHNPFFADVKTSSLMERSRRYNCLVMAPHPFAPGVTGIHKVRITSTMLKTLDAVEVLNGYNLRHLNIKALRWAQQIKKGFTGGSDGHTTHELGGTLTFTRAESIGEVLDEVRKRKTIVAGQEENIFQKAVLGVLKEETYIKKADEHREALLLIESQYKTEAQYLKKKILKDEQEVSHWFKIHHW